MKRVSKFAGGSRPKFSAQLEPDVAEALRAHWLGKATAKQRQQVTNLLCELRESRQWIACDCQSIGDTMVWKDTPIIMVRKSPTDTLHMYRERGRPEHDQHCPFHLDAVVQDPDEQDDQTASDSEGMIDPDSGRPSLGIEDDRGEAGSSVPGEGGRRGKSGKSLDSLFKVLAWLIEASRINRWTGADVDRNLQREALLQAAATYPLPGGGTFRDLLTFGTRLLPKRGYSRVFFAIRRKTPAGRKPVAFLLFVAEDLKRTEDGTEVTIQVKNEASQAWEPYAVEFPCDITFPARDDDEVKAPYLVLAKVVEGADKQPRVSRGVAQPIMSSMDYFPVDSDQERKTLRKLRSAGAAYLRHEGHHVDIEKPVQGRKTDLGLCRPDFLVHRHPEPYHTQTLVVETMGFDTQEYLERKEQLKARFLKLGAHLLEDRRGAHQDDSEADDRLFKAVSTWLIKGQLFS